MALLASVRLLIVLLPSLALAQVEPQLTPVRSLLLQDDVMSTALGKLQEQTAVAISVEHVLEERAKRTTTERVLPNVHLQNTTVAQVLDFVTKADGRYAWKQNGTMINVFPIEVASDSGYLLNRRLSISLKDVTTIEDAYFKGLRQIPRPRQLALLQAGASHTFSEAFTYEKANIPLRQYLNDLAAYLGRGYGWQVSGFREFKVLTFHARLNTRKKEVTVRDKETAVETEAKR
jgi:hypothetical protein